LGYGRHLGISQADLFKHRWQARLSQWFGRSSWLERLFVATLLASMLFSVQFALEEAEVQVFMREGETDAILLTNELPLDAYADRGFAVFLRNQPSAFMVLPVMSMSSKHQPMKPRQTMPNQKLSLDHEER
jgi:hypothetical protein